MFSAISARGDAAVAVSEEAWLQAMLDAEAALAAALAAAGVIADADAEAIAAACVADRFDAARIAADAASSGNPVVPLVAALRQAVGGDAAAQVHRGATSQDILDSAAMLVAARALDPLLDDLLAAREAAGELARAHRDTPIAGRTLLQQAVPTTFGLKAAGWLVALGEARERLVDVRGNRLAAQLGGAAGTLSALGDKGVEVAGRYAHELGLEDPVLPWHSNRVRVAELGSALDIAAGALAKVALDLVLLAQTEVGEVREGGDGGASTAMPHKRNPVGAMRTRACAEMAHGHASVLRASLVGEHERAAGAWQAEWDALSGALATTGGAAASLAESLEGLDVDVARMRANLDLTGGAGVTERLAATLSERLGRSAARDLVRGASLRAADTGRPLAEVLAGLDTGLGPEEIEAALDPTTYLGSARAFVERALARFEAAS